MGRFTAEEDQKILDLVKEGLEWPEIASRVDGRNTKQIRDRWNSKLDPELKPTTEPWTEDEDALLYHGYQAWGSAWGQVTSLITAPATTPAPPPGATVPPPVCGVCQAFLEDVDELPCCKARVCDACAKEVVAIVTCPFCGGDPSPVDCSNDARSPSPVDCSNDARSPSPVDCSNDARSPSPVDCSNDAAIALALSTRWA